MGARRIPAVYLSCELLTSVRPISSLPRERLQPTGNGTLQALNEAIVHAKQPLERPSARDLVAGLIAAVSDLTVHMRRSTDRPAAAGGHTMSPMETMGVD
jgi:hypothetical protein